jgi:dTDP-4-amino-4,6-dideoxygalactose transaminase
MPSTTQPLDPPTFPAWPYVAPDEIEAAVRVLRSGKINYWTGNEGRLFEEEFALFAEAKHAVALANGTLSLEAALLAGGIASGDEVIVTPRSFMASASAVVTVGARPVFADVDRDSGNLTAETIERVLSPRTKALLCVHLAGWPCEMDAIRDLGHSRGLFVIEDCAQAHGARFKGRAVGSVGHCASWSFCQDKIMTTGGEGGMLTTDDPDLWERAWSLKDHGKSYQESHRTDHEPGFRWLHESFGSNWRLTEMQSALGRVALGKVPGWVGRRRKNARLLQRRLEGVPGLRVPCPPGHVEHAYYKFYAYVDPGALSSGWSRDRIMRETVDRGVPCFSGSCSEIYLEKAYQAAGLAPAVRLPVARELGEQSLMLLVHPTLGDEHMEFAADVLRRIMGEAVK